MAEDNKNEVAPKNELSLFVGGGEIATYDYGEDAGAGFENSDSTDFAVPIVYVAQATSEYVKDGDGSIRGGMLYNNVTGEAVEADIAKDKPGLVCVPCAYVHTFNEWRPREAGGGLVEQHDPNSKLIMSILNDRDQKFGKYTIGDNDLIDTFTVFCLIVNEKTGTFEQAAIPHSSTKISVFKRMLQCKRNMLIPGTRKSFPIYSHAWRLQTKTQVNKGQSSFNIVWSLAFGAGNKSMLNPNSELYEAAKNINLMCSDSSAMTETVKKSVNAQTVGESHSTQYDDDDISSTF